MPKASVDVLYITSESRHSPESAASCSLHLASARGQWIRDGLLIVSVFEGFSMVWSCGVVERAFGVGLGFRKYVRSHGGKEANLCQECLSGRQISAGKSGSRTAIAGFCSRIPTTPRKWFPPDIAPETPQTTSARWVL